MPGIHLLDQFSALNKVSETEKNDFPHPKRLPGQSVLSRVVFLHLEW